MVIGRGYGEEDGGGVADGGGYGEEDGGGVVDGYVVFVDGGSKGGAEPRSLDTRTMAAGS